MCCCLLLLLLYVRLCLCCCFVLWLARACVRVRICADWKQLFDIVIFNARKPKFFTSEAPFRQLDPVTGAMSLSPVTRFKQGEVTYRAARHGTAQLGAGRDGTRRDEAVLILCAVQSDAVRYSAVQYGPVR